MTVETLSAQLARLRANETPAPGVPVYRGSYFEALAAAFESGQLIPLDDIASTIRAARVAGMRDAAKIAAT